MISCFRSYISRMRGHNDCVRTIARIPLLFPVESRFDLHFTCSAYSSARFGYVVLRAPTESAYEILGDDDIEFE